MKVLVLRLSSLGDVVLATAAVEALHVQAPEAEVHVLTKPAFRHLFLGNPGVHRVVEWDPEGGLGSLARQLRGERYGWIVDLHANLRTRLLRLLVPGPRWCVYSKGALRRRLAVRLHRPKLLAGQPHVIDRYLAALTPLGVTATGADRALPRLYPSPGDQAAAADLLRAAGWNGASPCVALAPGARWATKAWPAASWAQLAERLRETAFVAVVGDGDDTELARAALGTGPGANLAGRTTLGVTAAVLARAACLVSNDSAPLHLAGAVATPVVALFGPTVRGFGFAPQGPGDRVLELDLGCRPCSLHGGDVCPLGHHRCLAELSPEQVAAAVDRTVTVRGSGGG